jgi:putative ABC transport system ATP-binding protein
MFKIKDLKVRYKNKVIDYPDFEIGYGDLVLIKGSSGIGKSSLLSILGLIKRDYEGSAEIEGREIKGLSEREVSDYLSNKICYVLQEGDLIEELTVRENIELGSSGAISKDELNGELEYFGLIGFGEKKVYSLSGGEKRRVSLVKAILSKKDILILDEPFKFLDLTYIQKIFEKLIGSSKIIIISDIDSLKSYKFSKIVDIEKITCHRFAENIRKTEPNINKNKLNSKNLWLEFFKIRKKLKYFLLFFSLIAFLFLISSIIFYTYFEFVKGYNLFKPINENYVYISSNYDLTKEYNYLKNEFKDLIPIYSGIKKISTESFNDYEKVYAFNASNFFKSKSKIFIDNSLKDKYKNCKKIIIDNIEYNDFKYLNSVIFHRSFIIDMSNLKKIDKMNINWILVEANNEDLKNLKEMEKNLRSKLNELKGLDADFKGYYSVYSGKLSLNRFKYKMAIFGIFTFSFLVSLFLIIYFLTNYIFKIIFDKSTTLKLIVLGLNLDEIVKNNILLIDVSLFILCFPFNLFFKIQFYIFLLSIIVIDVIFYITQKLYLKKYLCLK